MRNVDHWRHIKTAEPVVSVPKDLEQVASDLCEKALEEAKNQLHPLLRNIELDRLDQRDEFIESFKSALERKTARKLATWHPDVQAVFKYDETRIGLLEEWDGSIHLLVKVPRLSDALRALGQKLDRNLVKCLRQKTWQRFRTRQSVLAVHQVTPNELRHGICYGAMFYSVYNTPIKVWPQNAQQASINDPKE